MFEPKNHGVIRGLKSTDWVAGQIDYEVRNPNGVWPLVRAERQRFKNVETMACVSFATLSACESQILEQTGTEINFSDRFLAKMSGTTTQGNRVTTVLDTLRHTGAVVEEEWPTPPEPFAWANYYSDIPQFIVNRGKPQFKDKYDLQYEYIFDHSAQTVAYHLKHAPLLITVPGHEMLGVALEGNKLTVLDTYPGTGDYLKVVKLSQITDIFKAVLTVKGNQMSQIKTQAKGPSRRLVIEAGTIEEWLVLCKIYGKDPNSSDEIVT